MRKRKAAQRPQHKTLCYSIFDYTYPKLGFVVPLFVRELKCDHRPAKAASKGPNCALPFVSALCVSLASPPRPSLAAMVIITHTFAWLLLCCWQSAMWLMARMSENQACLTQRISTLQLSSLSDMTMHHTCMPLRDHSRSTQHGG